MLSILIPVFNYDVTELVTELALQCQKTEIPFEIICVDDGSGCPKPDLNQPYFTWHKNLKNEGRAKTRNILASMAQHEFLLFLDADVLPANRNFIHNYRENFKSKVVCGGISYQADAPEEQLFLRWTYGKKHEEINADRRNKHPYLSFMTGNFMCHKSVFEKVTFNSSLTSYGHEDTLFGKELLENAIHIKHINNPIIHLGLENNQEFLHKSKIGITSLVQLYRDQKITRNYSKLIKLYENLDALGLKNSVIKLIHSRSIQMQSDLVKNGKSTWKLQVLKLIWFHEGMESDAT